MRRLLRDRATREEERRFVVEGAKAVGAALDAPVEVEAVLWDPSVARTSPAGEMTERAVARAAKAGAVVHELAPGVIERVADTVSPQPVLGVVPFVDVPLEVVRGARMLVVLAGVRDPGNAGTALRGAGAAGADGVLCCTGSVDVYNPKAVRAAAGSLFRVPVVAGGDTVEVLDEIGAWGMRRLGAVARDGADYDRCDLTGPVAFVVGNEAHGIDPLVDAVLDGDISIPMARGTESLNLGVAAAVLCFEAARQRRVAAAPRASTVGAGGL